MHGNSIWPQASRSNSASSFTCICQVNPVVPEFNDKMGSEVEEDTAAEMSSQAEYADGEQEPDDAEQADDNSENF